MKRLALLAAALTLCGVALIRIDASARPPALSGTPAIPAAGTAGSPVTMGWLRNHLIGFQVGPSRPTGFGEATVTAFTRGCPECSWFRTTNRITDHRPVSPAAEPGPAAPAAVARQRGGGFCWPWESFPWSGSGCWNNMSTWNWGRILSALNYHPVWDPMSTLDRILGCYHGVYQGFTGGVVGKQVVGIMIEMSDLVKVTPAGIAWSIIGGCTFGLFHH